MAVLRAPAGRQRHLTKLKRMSADHHRAILGPVFERTLYSSNGCVLGADGILYGRSLVHLFFLLLLSLEGVSCRRFRLHCIAPDLSLVGVDHLGPAYILLGHACLEK